MRIQGISVIVTTYNGAPWIQGALTSILTQTLEKPLEVIVMDDGSQDGTVDTIRKLNDARIRIYTNSRNLGTASSRNLGVQKAQFEWLAFNDQDDVWTADKLASQCSIVEKHADVEGVAGGYARLAKDGKSRWTTQLFSKRWSPSHSPRLDNPPYYHPDRHGTCYIQSLLIKKEALQRVNGFRVDLPIAYDPDLFLRLGESAVLAAVEKPVFLYRLSHSSITGSSDLDAKQFLASFAFMHTAQLARSRGESEPNISNFLENYQPTDIEIAQFVNNQFLRSVNTHWVTGGLAKGVLVALQYMVKQPTLISSLFSRLRWWAR